MRFTIRPLYYKHLPRQTGVRVAGTGGVNEVKRHGGRR
jgi:hypothetical protein